MKKIVTEELMLKAKNIMLEILLDVDKICKENNLTYLLAYGTCLGAIRHKGFIPWDNDIDIYLLRKDFNKLCDIIDNKYTNKYEITSPIFKGDKNFATFAKIYRKGTLYVEKLNMDNIYPKGVFIDIFPLDYMQNIKLTGMLLNKTIHILNNQIIDCMTRTSHYSKVILEQYKQKHKFKHYLKILIEKVLNFIFDIQKIKDLSKYLCELIKNGDYITCYSYKEPIYKTEDILPVSYAEFEGYKFSVPNNSHKYLEIYFGKDYMVPPPLEKRESHDIIKIQI